MGQNQKNLGWGINGSTEKVVVLPKAQSGKELIKKILKPKKVYWDWKNKIKDNSPLWDIRNRNIAFERGFGLNALNNNSSLSTGNRLELGNSDLSNLSTFEFQALDDMLSGRAVDSKFDYLLQDYKLLNDSEAYNSILGNYAANNPNAMFGINPGNKVSSDLQHVLDNTQNIFDVTDFSKNPEYNLTGEFAKNLRSYGGKGFYATDIPQTGASTFDFQEFPSRLDLRKPSSYSFLDPGQIDITSGMPYTAEYRPSHNVSTFQFPTANYVANQGRMNVDPIHNRARYRGRGEMDNQHNFLLNQAEGHPSLIISGNKGFVSGPKGSRTGYIENPGRGKYVDDYAGDRANYLSKEFNFDPGFEGTFMKFPTYREEQFMTFGDETIPYDPWALDPIKRTVYKTPQFSWLKPFQKRSLIFKDPNMPYGHPTMVKTRYDKELKYRHDHGMKVDGKPWPMQEGQPVTTDYRKFFNEDGTLKDIYNPDGSLKIEQKQLGGSLVKRGTPKIKFNTKIRSRAKGNNYLKLDGFSNALTKGGFSKNQSTYINNVLTLNPNLISNDRVDLSGLEDAMARLDQPMVITDNVRFNNSTNMPDETIGGFGLTTEGYDRLGFGVTGNRSFPLITNKNFIDEGSEGLFKQNTYDEGNTLWNQFLNRDPYKQDQLVFPETIGFEMPGLTPGFLEPSHEGIVLDRPFGWSRGFTTKNDATTWNLLELQHDMNSHNYSKALGNTKGDFKKIETIVKKQVSRNNKKETKLIKDQQQLADVNYAIELRKKIKDLETQKNDIDFEYPPAFYDPGHVSQDDYMNELGSLKSELNALEIKILGKKPGNAHDWEAESVQKKLIEDIQNTQIELNRSKRELYPEGGAGDPYQLAAIMQDPYFRLKNELFGHLHNRGFTDITLPSTESVARLQGFTKNSRSPGADKDLNSLDAWNAIKWKTDTGGVGTPGYMGTLNFYDRLNKEFLKTQEGIPYKFNKNLYGTKFKLPPTNNLPFKQEGGSNYEIPVNDFKFATESTAIPEYIDESVIKPTYGNEWSTPWDGVTNLYNDVKDVANIAIKKVGKNAIKPLVGTTASSYLSALLGVPASAYGLLDANLNFDKTLINANTDDTKSDSDIKSNVKSMFSGIYGSSDRSGPNPFYSSMKQKGGPVEEDVITAEQQAIIDANIPVDEWSKKYHQSDNFKSLARGYNIPQHIIDERVKSVMDFNPQTDITFDTNANAAGMTYDNAYYNPDGSPIWGPEGFIDLEGKDMVNYNTEKGPPFHPMYEEWENLAAHEVLGHVGMLDDNSFGKEMKKILRKLGKGSVNAFLPSRKELDMSRKDYKDMKNHMKDNLEMRANLMQLRYKLAKEGLYDSTIGTAEGGDGTNPFTDEHLLQMYEKTDDGGWKIKDEWERNELFQFMAPQDIKWMMNNVADASEKELPRAQAGKEIIKSLTGKYKPSYNRTPISNSFQTMLNSKDYQPALNFLFNKTGNNPSMSPGWKDLEYSLQKHGTIGPPGGRLFNTDDWIFSDYGMLGNAAQIRRTPEYEQFARELLNYRKQGSKHETIRGSLIEAMSQSKGPETFYKSDILRNNLAGLSTIDEEYLALQNMHAIQPHRVVQPLDLSLGSAGNIIGYNMEAFPGVSLRDYTTYGLNIPKYTMQNIDKSIKKLHRKGYVHGDLHAGNIMIDPTTGRDFRFIDPVGYPNIFDTKQDALLDIAQYNTGLDRPWTELELESILNKPLGLQQNLMDRDYKGLNEALLIPNNFTKTYSFPENQLSPLKGRKMKFGPGVKKYGGQTPGLALDLSPTIDEYKKGGETYSMSSGKIYQDGGDTTPTYDEEMKKLQKFIQEQEAGWDYIKSKDSDVLKEDGVTYYKMFEDGLFYPYYHKNKDGTVESEATIGFGSKGANVYNDWKGGMDLNTANGRLDDDITSSLRKTKIFIDSKYGDGAYDKLSDNERFMLTDYTYNLGKLSKFPNYADAIVKGDTDKAILEYKRHESEGGPELGRNAAYLNNYLQPWIDNKKAELEEERLRNLEQMKLQQMLMDNNFTMPIDNTGVGTNNPFGGWKEGGQVGDQLPKAQEGGPMGGNIDQILDMKTWELQNGWTEDNFRDWRSKRGYTLQELMGYLKYTQKQSHGFNQEDDPETEIDESMYNRPAANIGDASTWQGMNYGCVFGPDGKCVADIDQDLNTNSAMVQGDYEALDYPWTNANWYKASLLENNRTDKQYNADKDLFHGMARETGLSTYFWRGKPYSVEQTNDNILDWRTDDQLETIIDEINDMPIDGLVENGTLETKEDYYAYIQEYFKDDSDKTRLLQSLKDNEPNYLKVFSTVADSNIFNALRSDQDTEGIAEQKGEWFPGSFNRGPGGYVPGEWVDPDGIAMNGDEYQMPGYHTVAVDNTAVNIPGFYMQTEHERSMNNIETAKLNSYLLNAKNFNDGTKNNLNEYSETYDPKTLANFKRNYAAQFLTGDALESFLEYDPNGLSDIDQDAIVEYKYFDDIYNSMNAQVDLYSLGDGINTAELRSPSGFLGIGGNKLQDLNAAHQTHYTKDYRDALFAYRDEQSTTGTLKNPLFNYRENRDKNWWERNVRSKDGRTGYWTKFGQWTGSSNNDLLNFITEDVIFGTVDWAASTVGGSYMSLMGAPTDWGVGYEGYERFAESPTLNTGSSIVADGLSFIPVGRALRIGKQALNKMKFLKTDIKPFSNSITKNKNIFKGNRLDYEGLTKIQQIDKANPGVLRSSIGDKTYTVKGNTLNPNRTYSFTKNDFLNPPILNPKFRIGTNSTSPAGLWNNSGRLKAKYLIPTFVGSGLLNQTGEWNSSLDPTITNPYELQDNSNSFDPSILDKESPLFDMNINNSINQNETPFIGPQQEVVEEIIEE